MRRRYVLLVLIIFVGLPASLYALSRLVWNANHGGNVRPEELQMINDGETSSSVTYAAWPSYNGQAYGVSYSFRHPADWSVSLTSYGATEVKNYGHEGEPKSNEVRILITSFGFVFDCLKTQPCFESLDGLSNYLGYVNPTPTTIGGKPALRSTIPVLNANRILIRVGDEAIVFLYTPPDSTHLSKVEDLLATFRFH
jgi:hypothetical protein